MVLIQCIVLKGGGCIPIKNFPSGFTKPELKIDKTKQIFIHRSEHIDFPRLEKLIQQTKVLKEYGLSVRVYRPIIDSTSNVLSVILESGVEIPIQSTSLEDFHKYQHLLPHIPYPSLHEQQQMYERTFPDIRVLENKKAEEENTRYRLLRSEVAEYLRFDTKLLEALVPLSQGLSFSLAVKKRVVSHILQTLMEGMVKKTTHSSATYTYGRFCTGQPETVCAANSQCQYNPGVDRLQEDIHKLVDNIPELLQSPETTVNQSSESKCQLKLNITSDETIPNYAKQMAEELVTNPLRSHEITTGHMYQEDSGIIYNQEGDEILIQKPSRDDLEELLDQSTEHPYLQRRVPFDLVIPDQYFEYVKLGQAAPISQTLVEENVLIEKDLRSPLVSFRPPIGIYGAIYVLSLEEEELLRGVGTPHAGID